MAKRIFTSLHPRLAPASHPDPIPRINDLIRTAKAGWLGLLAYLAYVGVTLMGVIDADFFMPEKQTDLPLIGVSIPTNLFFWVAPALGAMLFAYLHLYLLKLWETLATAPARANASPLGDQIAPWLVADYALAQRRDAALRPAPLRQAANLVSLILVFAAAPFVLAGFWWRSMPKHDEALTVLGCGLPLFAALYVSLTSWTRMRRLARGVSTLPMWGKTGTWSWRTGFAALALMGWMTTEGTLEHYARVTGYYKFERRKLLTELALLDESALKTRFTGVIDYANPADIDYLADRELETRWWTQTWLPGLLVPAQLADTVFVQTPSGWLNYDQALHAFWLEKCRLEGLSPSLCNHSITPKQLDLDSNNWFEWDNLSFLRLAWCKKAFLDELVSLKDCNAFFLSLEVQVAEDWKNERRNSLLSLPKRDLSGADLRFADLTNAQISSGDLRRARMQGANIIYAQLEGAILSEAQLEGAELREVQMQSADLGSTRLANADFGGAQLQQANLRYARMERVNLSSAILNEANLSETWMVGAVLIKSVLNRAELSYADMSGTNLLYSHFYDARLKYTNLTDSKNLSAEQISRAFGDASVVLPNGQGPNDADWPHHWSDKDLPWLDFFSEYNKWLASPSTYVPPSPRPAP